MKFAQPQWLWIIPLLPVIFLALLWELNQRKQIFFGIFSPMMAVKMVPHHLPQARFFKLLFFFLALLMLVLALARPQWGKSEETVNITGLDIMLVVDISNSMWVEDVSPNRLKNAKRFVHSILKRLSNDRVGLVAFAGSAYLASPLTTDMQYLIDLMDALSPELISSQGTNMGAALETAVEALERGAEISLDSTDKEAPAGPSSKAIVLVSDGENLEGDLATSIKKLKGSGITTLIFGVGTEQGGRIPVRENGNLRGYKRDQMGQEVTSRFDPKALMGLASATDGKFWTLSQSETEVLELIQELSKLQSQELEQKKIVRYQERYQIPLLMAVIFLLCELSLSLTSQKSLKLQQAKATPLLMIFVILLANGFTATVTHAGLIGEQVSEMSDSLDAYKKNKDGITAYDKGMLGLAKERFGDAHAKEPQSPELIYNQSLIHAREQRYPEAIEGFTQSLDGAIRNQDHNTEQKSLYNLGILLAQNRNFKEAAQKLMDGLQSSKKNGDSEMEKKFRESLQKLQEQMMQQGKDQGDEKEDKSGKGKGEEQDEEKKKQQPVKHPKYNSEKLNKEDAEKVIKDLTREEKKIQMKLMEQKSDEQNSGGKEW